MLGLLLLASWLRLVSPNFELFTDTGERNGAQTLDRLETVRHVFLESIGGKPPKLPVRVFVFSSERDFRRFEPRKTVRGFHQGAADRDYIAVVGVGEEPMRAVRHEYIHLLLTHGSATLPLWLEEGTAELYSTVEMRAAGAVFGSPIHNHVRALNNLDWIPEEKFFAVGKDSPLLDHSTQVGIFYAQSWALAHMLNFSPFWRRNMPSFAERIDQGTPALLAFEPAFSASPSAALTALHNYVGGGRFATAVIAIPPRPDQAAVAEPLSEVALQIAQAELLLALGLSDAAAKLLDAYGGAPSPEIETARGLAALARKDNAVAKERFTAAMKLGDTTAVPAYEYAMLLRDEHAPDAEVRRYLTEAVGRNPNLAVAHFTLGVMAQRENRHRDAIVLIQEALGVLPRQSYFWHALAMSHLQLNQPELARRAAFRAAGSATTEAQLEMAQAALKLISAKPAAAPAAKKPSVVVPDSWKPREGSATVEGTLEQIDCIGSSARFHVRPAGGAAVQLMVDKPGEVLLKDLSSMTFTFSCGPQQPRRVSIEYDAESKRVTAIRFL